MPVARPQLLDPLPDAVAGDRVEADRRLVEHEQRRPVDERLGELEAAHHPARVRPREPVGRVGQAHRGERLVDALAHARAAGRRTGGRTTTRSARPVSAASIESCCGT